MTTIIKSYEESAVIIHCLAKSINAEVYQQGFLSAEPVRTILKPSKMG